MIAAAGQSRTDAQAAAIHPASHPEPVSVNFFWVFREVTNEHGEVAADTSDM